MTYLSVSNLKKSFGNDILFENVTFSVNDKDRACIVGSNGTGKSTLLKIILNLEESSNTFNDPCYISIPNNISVGYLKQDLIDDINNTLKEECLLAYKDVIKLEDKLRKLEEEISKDPYNNDLINEYSAIHEYFERHDGYSYEFQVDTVLTKFGFSKSDFDRKVESFSGGERSKIALAKLLLKKPDLLILDEPTNHLDVNSIDWLETYIKNYPGAVLFVSHDKYFINNTANLILNLENKKITQYRGNFDFYINQKKINYESQLKAYNIQQREIEKMERFIEYFKPKPRFVARAKDREKKLEHMVKIEKPKEEKKGIKFDFQGETRDDKKILYFDKLEIGYQTKKLANPLDFLIFGGDKIAIIGSNGTGKTTLIRTILKEIKPLSGSIRELEVLKYGYIKQNDFDIKGKDQVIDYIHNLYPYMTLTEVRTHLGRFDFKNDDVFKELDVLSGGEKMKLILAKIALEKYDVLLLDEPTNNLDMETRESLIEALQSFNSCIIFVSHDRYFIDLVANKILSFEDGNIVPFDGSYTEYKDSQNQKTLQNLDNSSSSKQNYKNKHEEKVPQKIIKRIAELESKILELEKEIEKATEDKDYKLLNELTNQKERYEEEYLSLMLEYE